MKRQQLVQKEWVLQKSIEDFVSKEVEELSKNQAHRLVGLLKNGCESAYIARYRGDVHGGLAPERIRKAMDAYFDALDLNKKVVSALSTVPPKVVGVREKQSVMERLKQCEDIEDVTDISKEFSSGTRKTKANLARELGLEPPAQSILSGDFVDLKRLVSKELKTVELVEENLKICLADLINRDPEVRKTAFNIVKMETNCFIQISASLSRDAAKKKQELEDKNVLAKYKDYIGNKWRASSIRDHTISALNRGTEEGVITWKVELNSGEAKRIHPLSKKKVNFNMVNFFQKSLSYSIETYFVPMIERGVKRFLSRRSENRSILIFGENVEQLFCQQGVRSKYVIALDPGKIVKSALLEPTGKVIHMDQFSIRGSTFEDRAVEILKKWSQETCGRDIVFAIGNGSNTHNTQTAVSRLIGNKIFPGGIDVCFCVVPEHGASKYSCTPAAQEEFGKDAEIKQISAVSIGRRLIDPMSEYVKIEPQHLGKGQYQLSVNDKLLKEKLKVVVRDRVSLIGVDLNTASKSLLQNICGLNQTTASEIVKYREQHGRFKSREELKKVKGIGEITFQQCAGFLTVTTADDSSDGPPTKRFKPSKESTGWSPFDETRVHPDDYNVASKMLKKLNMNIEDVINGTSNTPSSLTDEEKMIFELLISKPDLKPPPAMMKTVRALRDLVPGQKFNGTVTNKTDFGVFVDIGVEKDGLVHISHFRRSDAEIPTVGDQLEVAVERINGDRISLCPA